MGKLSWFAAGIVSGLAAAAVSQELAKPATERTWKGTVAGVPYNFDVGNWVNIANEYWNPESDEIMTPHTIGMGWGVNLAAVKNRVGQLVESAQHLTETQQQRRVPETVER